MPKRGHVQTLLEVTDLLEDFHDSRLLEIYQSLGRLKYRTDSQLIILGFMSLIRALSSMEGRAEWQSCTAFYNNRRLAELGFNARPKRMAIVRALTRLERMDDISNRNWKINEYDKSQLSKDVKAINPLLLAALEIQKPNSTKWFATSSKAKRQLDE